MPSVADKGQAAQADPGRRRTGVTTAQAHLLDPTHHLPSNLDTRGNFALLSKQLWNQTFSEADHSATASSSSLPELPRVLAVQFPSGYEPEKRRSRATDVADHTFLFTAYPLDQASSEEDQSTSVILSWIPKQHLADSSLQVKIACHYPLCLSSVILATSDTTLLAAARDHSHAFGHQIDGAIVRQGFHLNFTQGRARVVQTEPVLQGCITKQTDVMVVFEEQDNRTDDPGLAQEIPIDADIIPENGSPDAYSIDERFLADSVLEEFADLPEEDGFQEDAELYRHAEPSFRTRTTNSFQVRTIQNRQSLERSISSWRAARKKSAAESGEEVDEESSILLDGGGLAMIGGFNGDWAIAELVGSSRSRLVRLFSCPTTRASATSYAFLPPTLLQNLQSNPGSFSPFPTAPPRIKLVPLKISSFSSATSDSTPLRCPLPVPFADTLTIARVPSALSSNRAYQALYLDALKRYFEGRKRIVKAGDVIAVGVEKGTIRWVKKRADNEDGDKKSADSQTETNSSAAEGEIVDFSLPQPESQAEDTCQSPASQFDGVVQFTVSALAPELTSPSSLETPSEDARPEDLETRELARRGEFGVVVDPILTKMVQTGVASSRVGDCDGWLDIESNGPNLPSPTAVSPLTAATSPFRRIEELLEATLLPQAGSYGLHLTVLLKGARGSGKKTIVRWIAKKVGVHLIELDCFDILGDTDTQTEGVLRARIENASSCGPAILLLQNIDALARKSQAMETGQEPVMSHVLRSCIQKLRSAAAEGQSPVAVFGTTSDSDKCPNGILACFKHEINIDAPNEAERLQVLTTTVENSGLNIGPDVSLKEVATQTAALVAADLVDLVSRARHASVERISKAYKSSAPPPSEQRIAFSGACLTGADFDAALRKARSNYSESIGAPKIPNVTWDDVGGLASVKSDILDTIQLPLEHPELFTDGLKKRSGILLYGPPGTGKTLLAKAVATSCSLNFFSVKGPELLNMYIGESEANVRRVFQRARDAKPCVIFFDELDSVAPKRGNQGDSGGVMDRIVSQLLAELDGMAGGKEGTDVFVIGATNRPDLLDPALLRPGRFDRLLYLSVSETHAAQLNILQALTRKFKLDADLGDMSVIAERCPFNLTGADFYALCSDAMLKAMTRKASEVDERIAQLNAQPYSNTSPHPHPITPQYYLAQLATPSEIEVRVKRVDFEAALRELTPSVSEKEMEHYRSVQQQFSGPTKNGNGMTIEQNGHAEGDDLSPSVTTELMAKMKLANGASSDIEAYIVDRQDEDNGDTAVGSSGKGKGRALDTDFSTVNHQSSHTGAGQYHPPLEAATPADGKIGSLSSTDSTLSDVPAGAHSRTREDGDGTPPSDQNPIGKNKGKGKGKGRAR